MNNVLSPFVRGKKKLDSTIMMDLKRAISSKLSKTPILIATKGELSPHRCGDISCKPFFIEKESFQNYGISLF
jgi:hypothetical protein